MNLPPSAQIELWREKVKNGTITTEELREAIRLIRDGRMTAAAQKRTRAPGAGRGIGDAAAGQSAEDLLKELEDL